MPRPKSYFTGTEASHKLSTKQVGSLA